MYGCRPLFRKKRLICAYVFEAQNANYERFAEMFLNVMTNMFKKIGLIVK